MSKLVTQAPAHGYIVARSPIPCIYPNILFLSLFRVEFLVFLAPSVSGTLVVFCLEVTNIYLLFSFKFEFLSILNLKLLLEKVGILLGPWHEM